jgi:hypothetical protein
VEHYHDTFYLPAASGTNSIYMSTYNTHATMTSGTLITLGPNTNGQWEEVTVTGTVTSGTGPTISGVSISGSLNYTYNTGDKISYNTNLWLFNNFAGTSSGTGALYKFNANGSNIGSYLTMYSGGAYKDVNACTFF